jgi:hypothetical protein
MWNVYTFFKSLTGPQTYAQLTATADPILPQDQNGRFIPVDNQTIFAAAVFGTAVLNARINTPKLRQVVLPEIYPVNLSATVPNVPGVQYADDRGPQILFNDPLEVDVSNGGTSATDNFAVLFGRPTMTPAPMGPVYTLQGTAAAQTLVKGSWTNSAITFNQSLPYGRYSVIGGEVQCVNGGAWRLYFPAMAQYRPGWLCDNAYGNYGLNMRNRFGYWGEWGQFVSTAQPSLDIWGLAAGSQTPTIQLDVVKVG